MKYLVALSCIAIGTIISFGGCTKGSTARKTSTHFISATTSRGGSFYASGAQVIIFGATGDNSKMEGVAALSSLEFGFISYPGANGTYPIDGINIMGYYYASSTDTPISAIYGTITFTALTPDAIGTFTFTRKDSTHVTGSFNVAAP
jgi:hypothetical protein